MTYLGEFEQLLLLAILRLDRAATAASIRSMVEEASARKVWIGAVHTTLDRLEAKGLVASAVADQPEGRRKVFSTTPAGDDAIRHAYSTWERMTAGLKFVR
jgi:PadR family transcriptional regulator PadR